MLSKSVCNSKTSFTPTLKLKKHSQLTQSPFTGTDCLFVINIKRLKQLCTDCQNRVKTMEEFLQSVGNTIKF